MTTNNCPGNGYTTIGYDRNFFQKVSRNCHYIWWYVSFWPTARCNHQSKEQYAGRAAP